MGELERVESLEKRLRREEKEKDGVDRTKESKEEGKKEEDTSEMKTAKKEQYDDENGTLESVGGGALAMVSDNRVLCDLVDRVQAESRDSLFQFDLDLSYLRNEKIFEKKLRPWLERKMDLFMGGPQSDLVEYVLRRINSSISADALISDLSRYIDDHAEGLVERMWRMLVFELVRSGTSLSSLKGGKREGRWS